MTTTEIYLAYETGMMSLFEIMVKFSIDEETAKDIIELGKQSLETLDIAC